MDEYEKYEAECKKRREGNHTFLMGFTQYLEDKKLSKRTIDKHVQNIDFYINHFLLYQSPQKASEGVSQLDYFLGFLVYKESHVGITSYNKRKYHKLETFLFIHE